MKKHNKNESKFKGIEKSVVIVSGILAMIGVIFQISPTIQQLRSKIAIIDVQTEDLSSSATGIYMSSEDAMIVCDNDANIYKTGAMLHVLVKNPKDTNETIQECNLVVTSIDKLEESDVEYFLISFEDSVGVYAVNNGNTFSGKYNINLKLAFDDAYSYGAATNYKEENIIDINLQSGEVNEIFNYSYKKLDKIFSGIQQGVCAHITAEIDEKIVLVGYIGKSNNGYGVFKYQGSPGENVPIPIYLEYNRPDDARVVNNFPDIPNNSTLPIDFMLLPDQSIKATFYFDITFTNGNKVKSPPETIKILTPIYSNTGDGYSIFDHIGRTHIKSMIYDSDDFMDSDFIYDPEKLYGEYLEEYWK